MLERCGNTHCKDFAKYGARGIKVCVRWRSFEKFFADMGDKPPGTSLDRIDNNRGYGPHNCRWSTARTQANNTRKNITVRHYGKTATLANWARRLNLPYKTLWYRYVHGERPPVLFRAIHASTS